MGRHGPQGSRRAPQRLLLVTKDADQPGEHVIDATLTADGDRTILVLEERGMPQHQLAAYGAGDQVHVEDLAAHLGGLERFVMQHGGPNSLPAYHELAANVG